MWNSQALFPSEESDKSHPSAPNSNTSDASSKIYRPRLPATMATRSALNIVHGPPGIGKTILLKQWQEQFCDAGHRVVWVDAALLADASSETFWREVLRRVDRRSAAVAPDSADPQAEVRAILAALTGNVLLLVDNVRDADVFTRRVSLDSVLAAHPRFRTILAARTVSDDLTGAMLLGPEQLCFTDDELHQVLDAKGVTMSIRAKEDLNGVLRGWPGLIDVAAETLSSGAPDTTFGTAVHAAVDYLSVAMSSDIDPSPVTPFMRSAVPAACLHYAIDVGDWGLASDIIARSWVNLSGWHKALLFKALYAIPREEIFARPDAAMVFRFLTSSHPTDEEIIPLPDEPDELVKLVRGDRRVDNLVRAYTAVNWYRRGQRFGDLSDLCDRALVMFDAARLDGNPSGQTDLALGYFHVGVSHMFLGEFDRADRELKFATRFATAASYEPLIAAAAGFLALSAAFNGRVDDVAHWLWLESEQVESEQLVTGSLITAIRSAGNTARLLAGIENLDHEATMSAYEQIDDPLGELEAWPFIVYAISEWHRIHGDPHSNLELVRKRRSTQWDERARGGITPVILAMIEAKALLALGHGEMARKAIASIDHPLADHVKGLLLVDEGDPAGALALMDVNRWFDKPSGPSVRVERLLVVFRANDALRNRRDAAEALRQAIAVSEVAGNFGPYVHVPRAILASYIDDVPRLKPLLELVDRSGVRTGPEAESPLSSLSSREIEVLRCLSVHSTYAGVANDLFVSTSTVKTHVASIHKKLGTRERADLLRVAGALGILD